MTEYDTATVDVSNLMTTSIRTAVRQLCIVRLIALCIFLFLSFGPLTQPARLNVMTSHLQTFVMSPF